MPHKALISVALAAILAFASYADAGAPRRAVGEADGAQTAKPLIEINTKVGHAPSYKRPKVKLEILGHGLAQGTIFTIQIRYEGEAIEGGIFRIKREKLGESTTKVELTVGGGKSLFAGDYEIRATFQPARQSRKVLKKLKKGLGKACHDFSAQGHVFIGDKEDVDKERDMLIKHYRNSIKKLKEMREEFDRKYTELYEKTTGKKTNGQEIRSAKKRTFRPSEWRKFFDVWLMKLGRINDSHKALNKRYEAMRWKDCSAWLSEMIGSLNHTGITSSIKLYKDNEQVPEDVFDRELPSDPGSHIKSFGRNLKRIESRLNSREKSKKMQEDIKKKKKEMEKEEKKKKRLKGR
ncbi:MAG: hypothetical protein E3J72_12820 [Planctomycetota bacterium]|nr:MAG: hypothetical protein E3J72_12820 [Planctomycetota bacterium]